MHAEAEQTESRPDARPQFSLQAILGVFFFTCCLLWGAKLGIAATVAATLPLGILGWSILWAMPKRVPLVGSFLPLISCLGLALFTIFFFRPADMNSWLAVLGGVLWSLVFLVILKRDPHWLRLMPVGLQTLLLLYFFIPRTIGQISPFIDGTVIQDIHGGRVAVSILGTRFISSTTNTALLEDYLGPLEAQWKHRCCLSPYVRDGNERVDVCSLVFQEELPEILEMLPNHSAKVQVLHCLTDSENRLRVHQGLLLAALHSLGYPPGYNAETWWQKHARFFRQEENPELAALEVWGWKERIQKSLPASKDQFPSSRSEQIDRQTRAASNQERGWGGNFDFVELHLVLEAKVSASPNKEQDFPELGIHHVAWWSERDD